MHEFAADVAARGLSNDNKFLELFEKFLEEVTARPVFELLSMLDGEGFIEDGLELEVRVSGGDPLPTCLHEMLFPLRAANPG